MTKELPSPELLRKLLRYEPETGKLFWLPRDREFFKSDRDWKIWNTRYSDQEALNHTTQYGYKIGSFLSCKFLAHRIIWCIYYGKPPMEFLDHIDGNRSNNKISNLREATRSENQSNRKSCKNANSKYLGVFLDKKSKKWFSRIQKNKDNVYLGCFVSETDAAHAYDVAAKVIHGEFARLNFP